MTRFSRLSFIATDQVSAITRKSALEDLHGCYTPEEADALVVLGGDGLMLQTLHRYINTGLPIYGINYGSVGFLMNDHDDQNLIEKLRHARETKIHPLKMEAHLTSGEARTEWAINDVSAFRMTHQAAKLKIKIDGVDRLDELISDGVIVSTPVGSTAYNLSAYGPIIPIGGNLLALTPINPFRPRRWRGALLSDWAEIEIEVLECDKRPVAITADNIEVRHLAGATIALDRARTSRLLFDPGHELEERILREQFNL